MFVNLFRSFYQRFFYMVAIEKVISFVAVAIAKSDEMPYQYVNNPVTAIATQEK
jgi:hypothetical protein